MASITYPNSINSARGVPYVIFAFRDGPLTGPGSSSSGSGDTITLFMPPAFQIQDSHDYEFKKGGAATQVMQGGLNLGMGNGGAGMNMVGALTDALYGMIQRGMKGTLEGADAFAAAQFGGAVRDPKFFNYKEPKPREFTFNYKFEPKNLGDAKAMISIIQKFRFASYPKLLGTKIYGVPSSVSMSFHNFESTMETNENLVIKEVNTTLSEGDQVMTFDTGIPTQIGLQLQLAETKLLTKSGEELRGAAT